MLILEPKKEWKYEIKQDLLIHLHRQFPCVEHEYFEIYSDLMLVKTGYRYDGCSDKLPSTEKKDAAALPHDVFYQCIREGLMPPCWKKEADLEFKDQYVIDLDGYSWWGSVMYNGVKYLGRSSIKSRTVKINYGV